MNSNPKRFSKEKRQEQIKNIALFIITKQGLSQLTTRNIASQANISEGTIYRHFDSIHDIILQIINDIDKNLISKLHKISISHTNPKKRIKLYICTHYKYLYKNKGITILLFALAAYKNETEIIVQLEHLFQRQKKYFCKIIMDGIVEKIWDSDVSPEYLAELYMGIPLNFNVEFTLNKTNFTTNCMCEQFYSMISNVLEKK